MTDEAISVKKVRARNGIKSPTRKCGFEQEEEHTIL